MATGHSLLLHDRHLIYRHAAEGVSTPCRLCCACATLCSVQHTSRWCQSTHSTPLAQQPSTHNHHCALHTTAHRYVLQGMWGTRLTGVYATRQSRNFLTLNKPSTPETLHAVAPKRQHTPMTQVLDSVRNFSRHTPCHLNNDRSPAADADSPQLLDCTQVPTLNLVVGTRIHNQPGCRYENTSTPNAHTQNTGSRCLQTCTWCHLQM